MLSLISSGPSGPSFHSFGSSAGPWCEKMCKCVLITYYAAEWYQNCVSQQLSFIGFFNLTDIAHLVNPLSPGSETTRTLQIEVIILI